MARDDPHFRLRLPSDLKEQVEHFAKLNSRSINAEIVSALEHSVLGDAPSLYLRAIKSELDDLARRLAAKDHALDACKYYIEQTEIFLSKQGLLDKAPQSVDAYQLILDDRNSRPTAKPRFKGE